MDDVRPKLSQDPNNGRVDLDDSQDVRCYNSQSSSPISDEPKGLSVAVDIAQDSSPTKIKIYMQGGKYRTTSTKYQRCHINIEYIRPRVRISPEHERSSLDEIDFLGDEADPETPSTPALIDRRVVDTSPPIESVKHAISKFGGTVGWRSLKNHSFEKRKNINQELEKTHEENPLFKQQTEAEEEAKTQVLKDLEATNQLIEELELQNI